MARKNEIYIVPLSADYRGSKVFIHSEGKLGRPYVHFRIGSIDPFGYIDGRDLEILARNILHAIKTHKRKKLSKKKAKKNGRKK